MTIFMKFEYARVPIVDANERFKVRNYGNGERPIYHITARYGYSEHKVHLLDM